MNRLFLPALPLSLMKQNNHTVSDTDLELTTHTCTCHLLAPLFMSHITSVTDILSKYIWKFHLITV